ncbi:hypothetical protein CERSUDRAFT_122030 [Gelatoporia subvermispora B]|uniref:Uncharacterized protein n=1 Tax=Ceriporiopsis subvermispora (strain B) TaxID=914234 RepID=M2QRZ4_CERS8|nr:hypothetical protein CERSUDRAFT_122030 [Gelatoporia subvermispora B]
MPSSLGDIFAATRCQAQSLPSLSRVTRSKLEQFCVDISLVATSVRTGYLFDAFALPPSRPPTRPENALAALIVALRQEFDVFKNVAVLHEPVSEQMFILNMELVRRRLHELQDEHSPRTSWERRWTHFVTPSANPGLLPSAPRELLGLLQTLSFHSGSSIPPYLTLTPSSPTSMDANTLVPLAAFLLEYPVAYVPSPSSNDTIYLPDVPLDVYEYVISWTDTRQDREHVVLKFSCPNTIGQTVEDLGIERMVDRLTDHFKERLQVAGFLGRATTPARVHMIVCTVGLVLI